MSGPGTPEHKEKKNRHVREHRETNLGDWECPHCHRKVHEPHNLPPTSDVAGWEGICAQHEPGCEWCRSYAPPAVWKQQKIGAGAASA
jgi:hypothetical protein